MKNLFSSVRKFHLKMKYSAAENEFTILPNLPGVSEQLVVKQYNFPYKHFVIDNFFNNKVAESFYAYFEKLLSEEKEFSYFTMYDLRYRPVAKKEHQASDTLFSNQYKKVIESLFSRDLSQYTEIFLHNNTPREENKYIHTDWTDVVFRKNDDLSQLHDQQLTQDVQPFLRDNVLPLPEGFESHKRAITCIVYLNKNWQKGIGGETGIFHKQNSDLIEVASIEPVFNRLLLFEVTPHSYHNYKGSRLANRNSISQWLYD